MRGDTVYRIYGVHEGRPDDTFFGAFRTVPEAEAEIAKLQAKEMGGRNWAAQCHDRGFCPVGFYVPDWWDVHDDGIIPGSQYWSRDREWPTGEFGFVWGCRWGDDSSWKVQHLDLRRVQEGVITRDERFGYVELATDGWTSPCLAAAAPASSPPPPFIRLWRNEGVASVTFAVAMRFDLASGTPAEWQRLRIADFE